MSINEAIEVLKHTKAEMKKTFKDDPHEYWREQIEALTIAIIILKERSCKEE